MALKVLQKVLLSVLCVFGVAISPDSQAIANQDQLEIRQLNKNVVRLYRSEKYEEAIHFASKAMILMGQINKPSPALFVQTLNNLAELKRKTGDLVTAETLLLRSLKISVQSLGEAHSSVPIICSNLALIYEKSGEFSEAEALYQRSLDIREKKLGTDHPKVITLIHKIAALVKKRNQHNM